MDDRDLTTQDEANGDHWEMFADAMELTIEGHRLIAQEIGFEFKLLWQSAAGWLRDLAGMLPWGRSSPPV